MSDPRTDTAAALERQRAANAQSNAAATVLALTLPGDALLYVLLPLHAAAFGVTLPEAGILLAANRLVRIIGYGWVARFFERQGPRRTCTLATFGAALATLGYGVLAGIWALLVARLLWGLSFAALNISTQVLATQESAGAARRSGRSRAIVSAGPMVALLAGTALSEVIGPQAVFLLLGAVALLAYGATRRLGSHRLAAQTRAPRFSRPSRLDVWSFIQGLTLDGLFVIGLSLLAAAALPQGAAVAAGAALSLRYLCEMVLGPVGGAAAERYGAVQTLVALSIACALGLLLIGCGALWLGVLTVVVMRGMLQPLPAPVVARRTGSDARARAIATVATWRDLGAGIGPLVAGALIPVTPSWALYGASAAILALFAARVLGEEPLRRSA